MNPDHHSERTICLTLPLLVLVLQVHLNSESTMVRPTYSSRSTDELRQTRAPHTGWLRLFATAHEEQIEG